MTMMLLKTVLRLQNLHLCFLQSSWRKKYYWKRAKNNYDLSSLCPLSITLKKVLMLKKILPCLLCSILCFGSVNAVPEEEHYTEARKIEAFNWFRSAAEQGNARAQWDLAVMYYDGEGVPQNYTEAVKWFRMSADQGFAKAQCNLGEMYYIGESVAQDYTEAFKLFRLSADQGNLRGQFFLGMMYYNGQGVEKNDTEAARLLRLAADQGFADAQCNLGLMYFMGKGVTKSDNDAANWFRKAADQGNTVAKGFLKILGAN